MPTRILSIALLSAAVACRKAPAAQPPPPPHVQVVQVTQADVPVYRQWVGTLDGFVNADIRPQVAGYVVKQVYREGAAVKRGEVLFLIDARSYRAAAAQARSMLAHDQAALDKARLDVKRDQQLLTQDAIPQQQLDNDLAAEAEAQAAVATSRAALEQAELNRGFTQVTSPVDGIAGIAQLQLGSLVSSTTVLTTVSQVDPIKVQFSISELEYLKYAKAGSWPLELILDDGGTYPQRGRVVAVNRQVDARTGTIAMIGAFPNPGGLLRPGQYAKVRAAVEVRKSALLVPQRAVSELQGAMQVAVVGPDGKVDVRNVTGEQFGSELVVEKGVQAGESVIVEGFLRVRPGMRVQATTAVASR